MLHISMLPPALVTELRLEPRQGPPRLGGPVLKRGKSLTHLPADRCCVALCTPSSNPRDPASEVTTGP
jgi:hypothetical protein